MNKHGNSMAFIVLAVLILIALFIYDFIAIFKTSRLIAFYLRSTRYNSYLTGLSQKGWFKLNIKICGVILMLASLICLFLLLHTYLKIC